MKLDVSKLHLTKEIKLSESVIFDHEKFVCHAPLLEVKTCDVTVKAQRFEEFIYLDIIVTSKAVLQCSYTLKPFEVVLKGQDELHFSPFADEDDEDLIVYKGNVIDLDEYIFNIISASVPLSPKAPGAKINNDAKGYRVITDEELFEEYEEKGNDAFDALKDLDLD